MRKFFCPLILLLVVIGALNAGTQNITQDLRSGLFPDPKTPLHSLRCPSDQNWTEEKIAQWLKRPLQEILKVKKLRDLDNIALCTLPEKTLAHAFEKALKLERPDKPDLAMQFRMQQLSVYGVVKPNGLIRADRQRRRIVSHTEKLLRKRYQKRHPFSSQSAAVSKDSRTIHLDRTDWSFLGPDNIGGRIRTLYIHPKDPDLIFAGSVSGGIWRSEDGGASWSPVNDFMANLAITSIVADPRTTDDPDTTILYASTGEGFYNIDGLRGYGLFKSTDGGKTWNHIDATDPGNDSDWYYINRLAINGNGTLIAVARGNAIFTSTDGGDHWSKSEPGPHYYTMMEDARFDPNDDNKAIVGSVNGDIYYSTDEGQNWTRVNIVDASDSWISGRVELDYAAGTPGVIYASVDHNSGEIYRSDDGGQTWTYLSNPQHLSTQGWYANAIWVDPTDDKHLLIAGLDIYRSTDGGKNWDKISTWYYAPNSPHADHHILIADPNYDGVNNKRIYNANDGGLYKADDITVANDDYSNNGWTNLNNRLGVTQFYGGAGIIGSRINGGTQDNGSLIQPEDNGSSWGKTFGGDGGFAAVSHESTAGKYYYFGEYVYLKIHRSDDGAGASYIYENGLDDAGTDANFIAPFLLDPNNDNTMLAGGGKLWRSTNVSTDDEADISWSKIKDPVYDSNGNTINISQIAIASGNSDLILVGYNDGSIYKSTDGTAATPSWTKIHDANGKNVLALMIDQENHDLFYAGWGGFAAGNLQRSTDGGNSWEDLSQGLPEAPVRSIVRHPTRSDYLYVGTEVGLFTSEDGGSSWLATNNGPATVPVDQLFWYDPTRLVAVTHGRGMFMAKIVLGPCEQVSRPLYAYRWSLVSFPCDTGDNTIDDLLSPALGTYGDDADWVMYEQTGSDDYIGTNTQKRMMESNDTLTPGKGYWIITDANRTLKVNLDLPGLREVPELNASDLNISDDDFSIVFRKQLPDTDSTAGKKVILGNPFPLTIALDDLYFAHGTSDDGYHPMSSDDNSSTNPNAPYIKGIVYTSTDSGDETYKAVTPSDTPGFDHNLSPMTGFFIKLEANESTESNYMAFPWETSEAAPE